MFLFIFGQKKFFLNFFFRVIMTYKTEQITIQHGPHTFGQGTTGHCPERLNGLLIQLDKLGWKVNLSECQDFEMIKIIICDQVVYKCKDYLRRADFNTDGEKDPLVKEAVDEVVRRTDLMVNL